MKTVLEMASTFPRWKDDTEPGFIFEFCKRISSNFKVIVLAPHYHGAKTHEEVEGIAIQRFKYFFSKMQNLAYNGGIANNLKKNKLLYITIPFFMLFSLIALIRILLKQKISVIHAHWIIPQGLTAIIGCWITHKNIPILCTSHGGDLYCFDSPLFRKLKIAILNRCKSVSVVSSAMKNDLVAWGIDEKKISIISMGVDLVKEFCPDTSVQKKENTILFVGRLVPKKGVDILIKSIATADNIILDIVGDGPERHKLEQLAKKLEIVHRVNFLGSRQYSELPRIYQEYSISVVPSITAPNGDKEGFGLVTVEAMGCGCAVIASDYEAVSDIITNNQTGIIVEQGSHEELGKAIKLLVDNAHLRDKISHNGREFVLKRFDWRQIGNNYSKLLNNLN